MRPWSEPGSTQGAVSRGRKNREVGQEGCSDHPSPVESAAAVCTLKLLTAGRYCATTVRWPMAEFGAGREEEQSVFGRIWGGFGVDLGGLDGTSWDLMGQSSRGSPMTPP